MFPCSGQRHPFGRRLISPPLALAIPSLGAIWHGVQSFHCICIAYVQLFDVAWTTGWRTGVWYYWCFLVPVYFAPCFSTWNYFLSGISISGNTASENGMLYPGFLKERKLRRQLGRSLNKMDLYSMSGASHRLWPCFTDYAIIGWVCTVLCRL